MIELLEAKAACEIDAGDVKWDGLIEAFIAEAVDEFTRACGHPITRTHDYELAFNGEGITRARFGMREVHNVWKLERHMGVYGGWQELDPSSYAWVKAGAFGYLELVWPFDSDTVYRATIDVGYDETPPLVRQALRERVRQKVDEHGTTFGRADLSTGGGSVTAVITVDYGRVFGMWNEAVSKFRTVTGG